MGCTSCRSSNPCSCGEDTLDFPVGPVGPPGPAGPTGPTGATGPAGVAGTNGANGPTSVTKFVKDIYPVFGDNLIVSAAELTGIGMLRAVYNANTFLANQPASTMDFVYQIWFRDPTPGSPPLLSATEGVSPRVTAVTVDSLGGIHAVFAQSGGSYRIIIEG